jgi:hypothetical protein
MRKLVISRTLKYNINKSKETSTTTPYLMVGHDRDIGLNPSMMLELEHLSTKVVMASLQAPMVEVA